MQAIEAVSEVNDLETLWSSLKDQPGGFGRFSKWLVDSLDSYGMLWIKYDKINIPVRSIQWIGFGKIDTGKPNIN